jgi:hypothetical protein
MNRCAKGLEFLAVLFLACLPAWAHHGTGASYNMDKPLTLTGVVTEFVWSNPHCQIFFDVTDANGKVTNWVSEISQPASLKRVGWTRRELKAGDQITITVGPSKAGAPAGVALKLKLPNGKSWTRGDGQGPLEN